ncbi:MAG: hypothetical protein E6G10_18095 [Actinobacteria bacterium]|nr:MAG: hypothetical protein E6G10_18095 [Actinomycetota bacterium]
MRDVIGFEEDGRPGVLVASSVFADAATEQAAALGAPDARRVLVPHPVQDRTDEELRAMARAVVQDVLAAITT